MPEDQDGGSIVLNMARSATVTEYDVKRYWAPHNHCIQCEVDYHNDTACASAFRYLLEKPVHIVQTLYINGIMWMDTQTLVINRSTIGNVDYLEVYRFPDDILYDTLTSRIILAPPTNSLEPDSTPPPPLERALNPPSSTTLLDPDPEENTLCAPLDPVRPEEVF